MKSGLTHNEIAAIYREIVVAGLGVVEDDIPPEPWDGIIYHFSKAHEGESEEEVRTAISSHLIRAIA